MLIRLIRRANAVHPRLLHYAAATVLIGISGGIFETTLNNFLSDTFHITAVARGRLEFPRELPGFLTAVGAGALFFLPERLVASVAFAMVGIGMLGLGVFGQQWWRMLLFLVIWSSGLHLSMPVTGSLTMSLAPEEKRGRRLGQIGAVGRFGTIAGCLLVWYFLAGDRRDYLPTFAAGAAAAFVAALLVSTLHGVGTEQPRPRLLLRRRYWLYYALEAFSGARKQIFVTFGPWVLVKVFGERPATFAKLWMVTSVLGLLFQPGVGDLIDSLGERTILMGEGAVLFGLCVAYGYAERLIPARRWALRLLYGCYVLDQLLFAVGMARTTYVSKIAASAADVAPTLSAGVSINHAISMSIPSLGGYVWDAYGYPWVFVGGAGLALLGLMLAALVKTPPARSMNRQHLGSEEGRE
ncbi:MAG: MFS transporter [Armatimonadetes bacterium]|nr:MFS transporter [Armatimonadota bacterium]